MLKLQINISKSVLFMVAMATVPMATRPNFFEAKVGKSTDFQLLLDSTYAGSASHLSYSPVNGKVIYASRLPN